MVNIHTLLPHKNITYYALHFQSGTHIAPLWRCSTVGSRVAVWTPGPSAPVLKPLILQSFLKSVAVWAAAGGAVPSSRLSCCYLRSSQRLHCDGSPGEMPGCNSVTLICNSVTWNTVTLTDWNWMEDYYKTVPLIPSLLLVYILCQTVKLQSGGRQPGDSGQSVRFCNLVCVRTCDPSLPARHCEINTNGPAWVFVGGSDTILSSLSNVAFTAPTGGCRSSQINQL